MLKPLINVSLTQRFLVCLAGLVLMCSWLYVFRHGVCCSTSRMLKKSASGVLASRRGSPYRSVRLASVPYERFSLCFRHQPNFSAGS